MTLPLSMKGVKGHEGLLICAKMEQKTNEVGYLEEINGMRWDGKDRSNGRCCSLHSSNFINYYFTGSKEIIKMNKIGEIIPLPKKESKWKQVN